MATNINTLIQQIEQELNTLSSAQQHIEVLKGASLNVVNGFEKIQTNLDTYLKSYQGLTANVQKLEKEVKAIDFPAQFKQLNTALTQAVSGIESKQGETRKTVDAFVGDIRQIDIKKQLLDTKVSLVSLKENIEKLTKQIQDLSLPTKFKELEETIKKLDLSIGGLNVSVQNILSQIQFLERNLKDDYESKINQITTTLNSNQNQLIAQINSKNQLVVILLILNLFTIILLAVALYLKWF